MALALSVKARGVRTTGMTQKQNSAKGMKTFAAPSTAPAGVTRVVVSSSRSNR